MGREIHQRMCVTPIIYSFHSPQDFILGSYLRCPSCLQPLHCSCKQEECRHPPCPQHLWLLGNVQHSSVWCVLEREKLLDFTVCVCACVCALCKWLWSFHADRLSEELFSPGSFGSSSHRWVENVSEASQVKWKAYLVRQRKKGEAVQKSLKLFH